MMPQSEAEARPQPEPRRGVVGVFVELDRDVGGRGVAQVEPHRAADGCLARVARSDRRRDARVRGRRPLHRP